jgi:hypothetical protein
VFERHKRRVRGRGPFSYANVVASLALFVALGGTATAAVTLARDSVGARELRADAVRSPEIRSGAVRSSELRDDGVKIADISVSAQNALLGDLHVEERGLEFVDTCASRDITVCPNHAELDLGADTDDEPSHNWLVQAKLQIGSVKGASTLTNRCGLVRLGAPGPAVLLDEVQFEAGEVETIALSAVVKKPEGDPVIALRCTKQPGTEGVPGSSDVVNTSFVKITALQIGAVTGP